MDNKNIILIAIAVLIIALLGVAAFSLGGNHQESAKNATDNLTKNTVNQTDNSTNNTKVVGDNSTFNGTNNTTNKTYKVYNPQSDSYVTVIGEKFDNDVHRWYTYDKDGVRYYNTRIN